MEDELKKAKEMAEDAGFSILEPVDIGSLEDVKESAPLIPAAKAVKVMVKKVMPNANKAETYRWIRIGMQLVDGVDGKWQNSYIWSDNLCYYADPEAYDVKKNKNIYFGRLASLKRAIGMGDSGVMDDETVNAMINKVLLIDIIQVNDDYTGGLINRPVRYRSLPIEEQV